MKQYIKERKTVVRKFESKYVDKSERQSIKNKTFNEAGNLRTAQLGKTTQGVPIKSTWIKLL